MKKESFTSFMKQVAATPFSKCGVIVTLNSFVNNSCFSWELMLSKRIMFSSRI